MTETYPQSSPSLACNATLAQYLPLSCVCVRLCVSLSQTSVLSKWVKMSSHKQHRKIA